MSVSPRESALTPAITKVSGSQRVMPFFKSAVRGSLFSLLVLTSGCVNGAPGTHDAAVDPGTATDAAANGGGSCSEAGCLTMFQVELNNCPKMALEISPLQAFLPQPIMVTSWSVDPDADSLAYGWAAEPDGHFDNVGGQVTYYHCDSIGRKTLKLKVLDARGCTSSTQAEVSCINVRDFVRAGTQTVGAP